jgi:voltage-gated potassium channel Kch
LESRIGKLRDHYIICGFGRIGHLITLGEQPTINQLEKLAAGDQP